MKPLTRVLHVFGALECGGAETWLLAVLRGSGTSRYQHDICLLADHDGPLVQKFESLGCQVHRCPIDPLLWLPFTLIQLLREHQYNVVHSHVLLFSGVILTLARAAGVGSRIAHSHNVSDGAGAGLWRHIYRFTMRKLLRSSMTKGLACSEAAGEYLLGASNDFGDRLTVLRYGIHLSDFDGTPDRVRLRRKLGLPLEDPLITHVGSLTQQKNQGFLLQVFKQACRLRPDLKLLIIGEGPLRLQLERLVRALRLSGSVRLLGERNDVRRILAASDAFVLTSHYEGSPLSLLEAQAAGRPCLVPTHVETQASGPVDGSFAHVGLDEGIDVWADALAAIVDQPRRSAAAAGRLLAALGCDVSTSRARLEAVYEGEIDRCRRAKKGARMAAETLGSSTR